MAIPEPRYLVVDPSQTGYDLAILAFAGYDAQHFDFTPTQGLRDIGATGFKLLKTFASEAEINADSDLMSFRKANRPNALCRGHFTKLSQLRAFGFHMLGEAERSTRPSSNIVFLGPANSGAHDGSTPYDCRTVEDYKTNVGSVFATDTQFAHVGGCHAGSWGIGSAPKTKIPKFQDATGAPIVFSMDYLDDPAIVFAGHIDARTTNNTWSQPNAGSFPRVWKATYVTGSPAGQTFVLLPLDPTLSVTSLYDNHVFAVATSQSEVESTELSCWVNGAELWVHMPSDDAPTSMIGTVSASGWFPFGDYYGQASGNTAYGGLEFINCQYIGAGNSDTATGAMIYGGNAGEKVMPQAKHLGGRYLMGCSWKPHGACVDGTLWGRSTDGDICFDVSDRPEPDTDPYIQWLITNKGSDAATWAKMARFVHIDSAKEGIYWYGGGSNNVRVSGVLGTNIGNRHPVLVTKLGGDSFTDGDSHMFATQGGDDCLWEFYYVISAGAAHVIYANGDDTNTQNCRNNITQDFVIRDGNGKSSGAGGVGVDYTGQGNWLGERTAGNGYMTGGVIQRGYVRNIPSSYGSPNIDGYAIGVLWSDEVLVQDVRMEDCDFCIAGGLSITTNSTFAADPAYISTQIKVRNCEFVNPGIAFWNFRGATWFASGARPNIGYIDSDANVYTYPSSDVIATAQRFKLNATLGTKDDWQGWAKGSPPGAQVSVMDPNSTFDLAT